MKKMLALMITVVVVALFTIPVLAAETTPKVEVEGPQPRYHIAEVLSE